MSRHFDAIVLGTGGMGSAAAYHLARRGKSVLALERFDVPHEQGSSHGVSRIIRLAYFEHPSYVPLLRRAFDLWRDLESQAGERLLFVTGSVDASPEGGMVFEGSRRSCVEHGLPHEVLTGAELNRRFPGYGLPDDYRAVLQPDGGFLTPERCIVAHVTLAQRHGAEVRAREPALGWEPTADGVRVTTHRGTYTADRLVIAAGAWVGKLVPELAAVAVPQRQVLGWFQPRGPALFAPERFPVFIATRGDRHYYGLPVHGVPGLKVGLYQHLRETADPDTLDRQRVTPEDEEALRAVVGDFFPKADGPLTAAKVCMFTNTPDGDFVLDTLPGLPQVVVASPCSGHGFKFASVIGEIVADLALDGQTRHDIGSHRLGRLLG